MWRKLGCVILIVLVVGVIGLIAYRQFSGGDGFQINFSAKDDEEKESNFEAARVSDLTIIVEATGLTEPITDIDVKSEATGRILEFYVEEGDTVTGGDLICKLDQSNQQLIVQQQEIAVESARLAYLQARDSSSVTSLTSLQSAVDSARANLESATEAFETSQLTYNRIAELLDKGYATEQELDNAKQGLAGAQANLDSAVSTLNNAEVQLSEYKSTGEDTTVEQARLSYERAKIVLKEARKQLGDSVIVSPIDGIILEKLLDIGDSVVSINSSFGGSTTIVRVADMSRIKVRTSVDEIDIGKIEVGQSAEVQIDTYRDRPFAGVVTNIFPQGVQTGTGLISFIVIVEVDNSEGLLLGTMTGTVKIEAAKLEDVLLVPLAASRAGEEPDTDVVRVLKEGEDEFDKNAETEEREVKLGDTDFYDIVVLEGLEEGEMVKVRGFESAIRFD